MTVVDHDVTTGVTAAGGSALTSVADMGEAVEHTNRNRYGLGATVFSRRDGEAIARHIRSGAVSVNAFAALPLGGTWASGFGWAHCADGPRESVHPRATTVQRFPSLVRVLIAVRHGWR